MTYKVGQIFYRVYFDSETGKFETSEWHIRTIRGRKVTAIQKDKHTWVKLSTKNGDWGWSPKIDPLWRQSWSIIAKPWGLGATRLDAWKIVRNDLKEGWLVDPGPALDKALVTADKMIKRLQGAKNK